MTKIYQRYIGWTYIKNVFVIFIGLLLFYTGVDYINNLKDLPESANLQLMYVTLNTLSAINYLLPLSIVFGMIVSKFNMIRSNELICLYATGISKKKLLMPIFSIAMLLTFIYIGLNFTPFAYASEYRSNLLKNSRLALVSEELFLKYKKSYVYIGRLDPLLQEAKGIRIFDVEDRELLRIVEAKKAFFKDNAWDLHDGNIVYKPSVNTLSDKGLNIEPFEKMSALEGFKPKIIENAHQGEIALTISDAIDALRFFSTQNVDTSSIKSTLYSMTIFPFFAPLMLLILYYFLPASGRFFNLALLSFIFVFITLSTWGILFVLVKLSQTTTILPEIGIILPIFLMALYGFWLHIRSDRSLR